MSPVMRIHELFVGRDEGCGHPFVGERGRVLLRFGELQLHDALVTPLTQQFSYYKKFRELF